MFLVLQGLEQAKSNAGARNRTWVCSATTSCTHHYTTPALMNFVLAQFYIQINTNTIQVTAKSFTLFGYQMLFKHCASILGNQICFISSLREKSSLLTHPFNAWLFLIS